MSIMLGGKVWCRATWSYTPKLTASGSLLDSHHMGYIRDGKTSECDEEDASRGFAGVSAPRGLGSSIPRY